MKAEVKNTEELLLGRGREGDGVWEGRAPWPKCAEVGCGSESCCVSPEG